MEWPSEVRFQAQRLLRVHLALWYVPGVFSLFYRTPRGGVWKRNGLSPFTLLEKVKIKYLEPQTFHISPFFPSVFFKSEDKEASHVGVGRSLARLASNPPPCFLCFPCCCRGCSHHTASPGLLLYHLLPPTLSHQETREGPRWGEKGDTAIPARSHLSRQLYSWKRF